MNFVLNAILLKNDIISWWKPTGSLYDLAPIIYILHFGKTQKIQ